MTKNEQITILTVLAEASSESGVPKNKASYTRSTRAFAKMVSEYTEIKKRAHFLQCLHRQECSFITPLEDKCAACYIRGILK